MLPPPIESTHPGKGTMPFGVHPAAVPLLCLMLALPGCATPPEPPPHAAAPASHRPVPPRTASRARPPSCEQAGRVRLTDAQEATLFDQFDAWQREHDPAAADAPVPPPGPGGSPTRTRACRVSRP